MHRTVLPASIYATPARADLQGLRAIAVIAVVLFHAHLPGFAGGYVGVDVFFVLSGFLITRKLFREVDQTGRLDYLSFVADRAKRLLPNAATVILVTLCAGVLLLPAYRYAPLAEDARAAALFFANFHFASEAVDYLRLGTPPSPFMHFWSLSIEEQFYLAGPAILAAMAVGAGARSLRSFSLIMIAACAGSFLLSLWVLQNSQPAAFFQTQSRIWQLAAGGLIGIYFHHRTLLPEHFRAVLGYVGLCCVIWAIATFSDELLYPGFWALVPTVGAGLLIIGLDAAAAAPVAKLLSWRPMVWVGDRSYSLYLWHWPILVFTAPTTPLAILACLFLIVLLSALAYSFIERPIHRAAWPAAFQWQRVAVAISASLTVFAATFLVKLAPTPAVATERSAAIAAAGKDFGRNYKDSCHRLFDDVSVPSCRYGADSGRAVVLFGDSHAAHWFEPLKKASSETAWQFRTLTKTGCPSADVTIWYPPQKSTYTACLEWRRRVLEDLVANPVEMIILANYSHYSGWLQSRETGRVLYGQEAAAEWVAGMKRTVDALLETGAEVILVRDNPKMYQDYRECLYFHSDCSRPRAEALAGLADEKKIAAALGPRVRVLDLSDQLCSATECPAEKAGQIIYQDEHHLTASFAATLWRPFSELLSQLDRTAAMQD